MKNAYLLNQKHCFIPNNNGDDEDDKTGDKGNKD